MQEPVWNNVQVKSFDPVKINQEIDWSIDPYNHPTWRFGFHSLDFLWPSIESYKSNKNERKIEEVTQVVRSWIDNNPQENPPSDYSWSDHSTAKRTHVLACLYTLAPTKWLKKSLDDHIDILRSEKFYNGEHNHGIYQNVAMLIAGCVLDDKPAILTAEKRFADSLAAKVDKEGVVDEQAPDYQSYVFSLHKWYKTISQDCKLTPIKNLPDHNLMYAALAEMQMPNGKLVPLGDSFGPKLAKVKGIAQPGVKIFDAGYIFGRSNIGSNSDYYAIKFGPKRYIHGHFDHTSLYLYSKGQPRLIEVGHIGYERTKFRQFTIDPSAHNVVVMDSGKYNQNNFTSLLKKEVNLNQQTFTFLDKPYKGVVRQRKITISFNPLRLEVIDMLDSRDKGNFQQLWHLPPKAKVNMSRKDSVVTYKDGVELRIRQLIKPDEVKVVKGSKKPYQGWVSKGPLKRAKAPVVISEVSGRKVTFHTLININ